MTPPLSYLFVALLVLTPIIGILGFYYLKIRRKKQVWTNIQESFGFQETDSHTLEGDWNGHHLTITYRTARRSDPPSLAVRISGPFEKLPKGTLRAENRWDKLAKAVGLAREFQSVSDTFNQSVYVSSDDPNFKHLIRDTSFRHIVSSLITSRYTRIHLRRYADKGELEWKTAIYYGFWKQCTPSYLESIFSSLVALQKYLGKKEFPERETVRESTESASPPKAIQWLGYGIPLVSLVFGFILFFWGASYPTFSGRLQLTGLKIAGITLLVYLPVGYYCFRGRSKSHKVFSGLVLCALLGLPLFMIGGLTTLNSVMDKSLPVWHEGETVSLRYDDGDYFVRVAGVHKGITGKPKIEIPEQLYNRLRNRDNVWIKVRDGYLSEPWVSEISLTR